MCFKSILGKFCLTKKKKRRVFLLFTFERHNFTITIVYFRSCRLCYPEYQVSPWASRYTRTSQVYSSLFMIKEIINYVFILYKGMTTMMKRMMPVMSHYWASELTWTHCPWNPSLLEIDTCHLSFLFLVSFGHLVMTIMMTTMMMTKLLDSIWIRCCRIKWHQQSTRPTQKKQISWVGVGVLLWTRYS